MWNEGMVLAGRRAYDQGGMDADARWDHTASSRGDEFGAMKNSFHRKQDTQDVLIPQKTMHSMERRQFIKTSGLFAGGVALGAPAILRGQHLNSRVHVACIGVGGKGSSDVDETAAAGGAIVALCDVDSRSLRAKAAKYPDARTYVDFRNMLSEMDPGIDAVVISTPDHLHGVAAKAAMDRGKHIFCQKPLTQTVQEARELVALAKDKKLATQMGNQGSAGDGLRRAVEVIQAGVIGQARELHVWSNRPVWPQGLARPAGGCLIPKELDWNLWLGPAPWRPYLENVYHPFQWRGWTDFGTGALGDMACHTVNMPYRALKLGYPTSIECEMASRMFPETYPLSSRIRFEFPERDGLPPLKFWWYDGCPSQDNAPLRPYPDLVRDVVQLRGKLPPSGCLVMGDKGKLFAPDDYGATFFLQLEGEERFVHGSKHGAVTEVEQSIPRSPGHYKEWIEMIQGGPAAYSNVEIAGALTEIILLGCIAVLVGEGVKMEWDGPQMCSPNCPDASRLVKREDRVGW
jgi:hypothetical protein